MPNYKYKYLKYKTKCQRLKRRLKRQQGGTEDDTDEECSFTKFPDWIIQMSKSDKYTDSVDYGRFTITKQSVYSSELPFHISVWKKIVNKIITKITSLDNDQGNMKINMLDMTANIGGLSINMANLFSNLNIIAVELDRCTHTALTKNIKQFDLEDQITAIRGDSTKFISEDSPSYPLTYDFVVIDPPWGGPDYKKHKNLKLYLGKTDVHKVVHKLFNNQITQIVLLKAPTNFKFRLRKKYHTKRVKFMKPNGRDLSYYVYYITNTTPTSPTSPTPPTLTV